MQDMGIVLNTNMPRLMRIRQPILNKSNETWNTWKRKVGISTVPSKEDVAIHGISKGILNSMQTSQVGKKYQEFRMYQTSRNLANEEKMEAAAFLIVHAKISLMDGRAERRNTDGQKN